MMNLFNGEICMAAAELPWDLTSFGEEPADSKIMKESLSPNLYDDYEKAVHEVNDKMRK